MKLISMTDFVLERFSKMMKSNQPALLQRELFTDSVLNYANFLRQPLTLGMFVPCDDDDNFVEGPKPIYSNQNPYEDSEPSYDKKEVENYKKAIEKVLFDGFTINDLSKEITPRLKHENLYLFFYKDEISSSGGFTFNTIEDLIRFNVDCTVSF